MCECLTLNIVLVTHAPQVKELTSMQGPDVDKAGLRNNVGGNQNWMGAWVQVG